MKVIRVFIALFILLPLSYSFALQFAGVAYEVNLRDPLWFWLAFGCMFICSLIFIRQSSFAAILKHELTHNLFAILAFQKPVALHVKAGKGGEFHHQGKTNVFMLTAPYFFPLISAFILLISLFDIGAQHLFLAFLGIAAGFDLSTAIKDIHLKQTDLRYYGLFFSFCFVILMALITYGMLLAYITGGFSNSGRYFTGGFLHLWERIRELLSFAGI